MKEQECDPNAVGHFLETVISEISEAIKKKYKIESISKEDIEKEWANSMGCSTQVVCEFVCAESRGGNHKRKYSIQILLRSGYCCFFNLDFNVIQYDVCNNVLRVNRDIRFRSKTILEKINLAIEYIRYVFANHAKEAYIANVFSNGEVSYAYY